MAQAQVVKGMNRIAATLDTLSEVRSFVLVNPMDRLATPGWDGSRFYIPPKDEVVKARRPGQFESYKDPASGKYIPGTLVVKDIVQKTPLGDRKVYDVVRAIRESLGIKRLKNGTFVYEKDWGAAGIGVVMDGATLEEVEEVRRMGNERWKEHELGVAQMHVHAYESQQAARAKAGMAPLPESSHISECRRLIATLDASRQKKLLARFDLDKTPGVAQDLGRGRVEKIKEEAGPTA